MHRRLTRAAHLAAALSWLGLSAGHAGVLSSFQAGDGGWQLGTLAVGHLDNSGQLDIVVPYRNSSGQWLLDAFKPDGTRLPGFPYNGGSNEINVSPTLYDLDGDGRDEIIFTCGTSVMALRGDGSLVWSNQVNRLNYVPDSGYMVVTNGFYWSNGGGFISHLPANAVFSSEVSSPMIADVNGDGKKEVVTAWKIDPDSTSDDQDFNPFISPIWGGGEWGTVGETWSGGVVFFDAATGAKQYIYHIPQLVESGLALGHADTNRPLDTYVLNDSGSVVAFDKTKPNGFFGSGNLIGQFGKNSQVISGSYEIGVDVFTADLNGDGLSEVLVPTTQYTSPWQPNETVLDHDGAVLWRQWKQQVNFPLDQWQNNACMIPVNPDHDNHIDVLSFTHSYEINFRYWDGVELVDHPGWPKSFYPYLPTPPVVGDVDGDGQEEIIIGTYNPAANPSDGNLYVFALDGTLKFSVPVPGGLKHIPSIANIYGNGLDVAYRSLAGRIYIQNFGSTSDGPVSWSTHRGNKHRDGNLGVSLFPPGTPMITSKVSGNRRASFSWSVSNAPQAWRIYRAEQPAGPFTHIVTLTANTSAYTDTSLKPGCQYIYEVAAVYPTNTVLSAPFPVLSGFNSNLVANSGFEEDDNSHWDKWWGDINWTNMTASTNVVYQGKKSMQITLLNQNSGASISQYNQYGTPYSTLPVAPGTLYSFGGFFKSGGISQPSQQWLQWTSTKTAANTNDRPTLPYPNYFTPYFNIDTAETDWTYANRTFVMPAGFPNVELSHWYSVGAPASGSLYLDNLFFRALPAPAATNWTELIPFGSAWRYAFLTPPPNWFAPDFDDALWLIGKAKFGAGGGPANITTLLPQRLPLYYFRREFVLPSTPCEELLLSATCTDAGNPPDIYLNGTKLVTSGIDVCSNPGNEVRYFDLTPFTDLLHTGTNTIAVALHNVWAIDWDDIAFDLDLKAVVGTAVADPGLDISMQQGQAGGGANGDGPSLTPQVSLTVSVPPNTVWRVESADSLSGPWELVEVVTNTSGGPLSVVDTGQNGRLPPSAVPTRFYRIVPN
ncbi:MAG TPA: hypothetical protein VG938_02485 [Verrucomicrobiae bacterium]|jgi:hypothetical protein|nr:hypothetical protein [Verrucomicrobiae bacterium]